MLKVSEAMSNKRLLSFGVSPPKTEEKNRN